MISLSSRKTGQLFFRGVLLSGLCALCSGTLVATESGTQTAPEKAGDLYKLTNVWTVHLKFTPEQWEAMEPKGGGGFGFGGFRGGGPGGFRGPGPGGPGGPGGPPPGGPGGPPGGPGGFGPGMFLAPAFLKEGDANSDGKLSREEFDGLASKWFTSWDKEKKGKITDEELRNGLNSAIMPPGMGRGRRGGMNLQGPEGKRNGLASAAGIEFNYVHADLEFAGKTIKDVGVRYKGNGTFMESRGSQKRSMKIDLDHFVKGQKFAGVSKLNLHNNVTDASYMNEPLAHKLYRDGGVPAPRSCYAKVYATVPGKFNREYLGIYSIIEDVDSHFVKHNFANEHGAVFKPVTPALFDDLGEDWKNYNQTYDPKTKLSEEQKKRVIDLCKLVSNASDAEFAAKLGDFIDLEEFSRYMAVMVWLADLDGILGPGQNFYLYLDPKTQKFSFIPWDQDHSWGQFGMRGTQDEREHLSIHKPWQGENHFLERVYKVEAFKKPYLAHLEEFSKTIFRPHRFEVQVDQVAAAIRPAVKQEGEEKLERFDKAVSGEETGSGMFRGFGQPLKPIKPFAKIRAESVIEQVAGKSEGKTLAEFGFGPRGGRGGGPGRFGPGNFLGGAFMTALDADKDGALTKEEFSKGFGKWFESWNTDKSGALNEEQLRAGINQDLSPFRGGFPGGPGFGPPGGGPRNEP